MFKVPAHMVEVSDPGDPQNPPPPGSIFTVDADGNPAWLPPPIILIENGAPIPVDTPVGTIIVEKGA